MWRTIAAGVAVVVLAACGGDDSPGDAGARLACRDFRSAARDQTDGLLTPSELRDRLKAVNDNARLSEEPDIAQAGQDLLAEATTAGDQINNPDYAAAVTRFGTACEALDL
jgi:hypothetical protein